MQVITSAIDSRDGVFIGGKHLHHNLKPMTNTELTLDQLTAMAGGSAFVKLGDIKAEASMHQGAMNSVQFNVAARNTADGFRIAGGGKGIVHPEFRVGGSANPGGDDV